MRSQFNPSRRQFLAAIPAAGLFAAPALKSKKAPASACLTPSGGDDGPQILAALNTPGKVRLSPGLWRIDTPVIKVVDGTSHLIEGEGDATTLLVSCDPGILYTYATDSGFGGFKSLRAIPSGNGGSLLAAYPMGSQSVHGRFSAEDVSFVADFPPGGIHWLMALYRMRGSLLRGIRVYGGTSTNAKILIDTESSGTIISDALVHGPSVGFRVTGRDCHVTNSAFLGGGILEAMESGGSLRVSNCSFDGGALSVYNQSGGPVRVSGCAFTNYFFTGGSVRVGQDAVGSVDGVIFDNCQFPTHYQVRSRPNPRINTLEFRGCRWQYETQTVTGYPVVIEPGGSLGDLILDRNCYDGIGSNQSMGLLEAAVYDGSLMIERVAILGNELKDWNGANTGRVLAGLSVAGSGQWLRVGKLDIRNNRIANSRAENLNQYLMGLWGPVTVADAYVEGNDFHDLNNREIAVGNGAVVNATYRRNRGLDE